VSGVAERWVAQQFVLDEPSKPAVNEAPSAPQQPTRAAQLRDPERTITVAEFYERLGSAVRSEFSGPVWVSGEIRKVTDKRGHRYIELADRDTDEWSGPVRDRVLEVVCWAREWTVVRKQLTKAGVQLAPGLVVRVQGRVSVWDGGGKVHVSMLRIDVSALLGDMAAARARLLSALAEEGVANANRTRPVPLVPLRVGVVTSAGSQAYHDFAGRLRASGFRFEVRVEDASVQGPAAPRTLAAALRRIANFQPDVVVLVRGGGARTDLVAFDSEAVARAIVSAPFPIWTGIGHSGDRSVADEVANKCCITPTACGEAVVERVAAYWERITGRTRLLSAHATGRLDQHLARLEGRSRRLEQAARHQLGRRADHLSRSASALRRAALVRLDAETALLNERARATHRGSEELLGVSTGELATRRAVLAAFDPARQLERGWALVRSDSGRAVRSAKELANGDEVTIVLSGGRASATVQNVEVEVEGK
jgi:exodeoxyribonuclease VII large subunit